MQLYRTVKAAGASGKSLAASLAESPSSWVGIVDMAKVAFRGQVQRFRAGQPGSAGPLGVKLGDSLG